jgi:division protein CdvB (Snf7/Vps24/ESCRT-III family)
MGTGEETARFAFDLDTSGMQSGANAGASSLEALQDSLEADKQAVKDLQEAIRLLRGATTASASTIDEMKNRLNAAKNSMAGTAAQIIKMDGALTRAKKVIKGTVAKSGGGLPELINHLKQAPGAIGAMARSSGTLLKMLGVAGVAGACVVAVAAIAAVPVAVAAAVAGLSKLTLGFADLRREEMIQLEGMTRLRSWWGFIPGKASDVQAAIDKVSDSTATGRDKIAQYASELYKMGLRGGDLESMLEATSMKFSIQGEEAANRFKGMAFGARMLGMSVKQMADTAKARLGDLNARQVIGFSVQMRKLKDNLPRLFDTVKIDGFLQSMRKVTSLFSLSTQTGKSLQAAMGTIFSTSLGSSGKYGDVFRDLIRVMVLGITKFSIAMLELEISWLKSKSVFKELLPKDVDLFGMGIKASDLMKGALKGVTYAALGVTGALVLAGIGAWGLYKAGEAISGALRAATKDTWDFISGIAPLAALITSPFSAVTKLAYSFGEQWRKGFRGGGKAIVMGIIEGIKSDFDAAKNAVKGLGSNLKTWFQEALGIHSPSTVFRVQGRQLPRGAALGIQDDQSKPRMAVQNMVTPAAMNQAGASGAAMRSNRTSIDVGGITISTTASKFEGVQADLESAVAAIFERAALQAGVG